MPPLDLTVVSPRNPLQQHVPAGFGYVGQVFEQARLRDELTQAHVPDAWLGKSLQRLTGRFRGRLRVRWIDPWSLGGLLLVVRHRVRTFPTVVIDHRIVYTGDDPAAFEALVVRELETPPTD